MEILSLTDEPAGFPTPKSRAGASQRWRSVKWYDWPIHPILFAVLPVISLLAPNISQIHLKDAVRPLLLCLLLAAVAWSVARIFVRSLARSAFVASLFLLLFFSFGHVYLGFLGPKTGAIFQLVGLTGQQNTLILTWLAIFVGGTVLLALTKVRVERWTFGVNAIALIAMLFPLGTVMVYEYSIGRPYPLPDQEIPSIEATLPLADDPPDIYYIILDGYARSDVLKAIYGIDNGEFLRELEILGFTIADESRSNYIQTTHSLASALNMTYLEEVAAKVGPDANWRLPLARLIRWSRVKVTLDSLGYTSYAFETGSRTAELDNADVYLIPPAGLPTNLERLMLETSSLVLVPQLATVISDVEGNLSARAHRARIQFALESLPTIAREPGPKFVFAHILTPHPPFILLRDGSLADQGMPFSFDDGNGFDGSPSEYLSGYSEQVQFITPAILGSIRGILANSAHPPIIILQADHGPGSGLVWDSIEGSDVRERTAILNAILLPGAPPDTVYPSLTPVNTFRIIFNEVFGAQMALLPDRSYFSTWEKPYDFLPIPEEMLRTNGHP